MQNGHDNARSGLIHRLASRPEARSAGVVVLVFGLLLWARFLLVTGHPRTAIADPPPSTQAAAAEPSGDRDARAHGEDAATLRP